MCKFVSLTNPIMKQHFLTSYTKLNITQIPRRHSSVCNSLHNENQVIFNKAQITRMHGLWPDQGNFISTKFSYNVKEIVGQRMIHTTNVNRRKQQQNTPNIIYYQSPVAWLKNKYHVNKLQRTWDPEFSEVEFIRGTKQAVSVVTQMMSINNLKPLEGLVIKPELLRIEKDIKNLWHKDVIQNLGVTPEEIKLAVPIQIKLDGSDETRFCIIDMFFVALKWLQRSDLLALHLVSRFFRNYSDNFEPEWIISKFYVKKYHIRRSE